MKKITSVIIAFVAFTTWISCSHERRYTDLNSGEKIVVKKDDHGRLVNAETLIPVRFYVDSKSKDTIDGRTGKVVNGELMKVEDGTYEYISVREALADDDYKKKIEDNRDVKIKTGNKKIKINRKTGEKKIK